MYKAKTLELNRMARKMKRRMVTRTTTRMTKRMTRTKRMKMTMLSR